jgi:hypothetical protein
MALLFQWICGQNSIIAKRIGVVMSKNESSKKIDSNIIIAVISAIVTILVALIPFVGPKLFADKPTPTPTTALVYTDTVTSTQAPTNTIAPTDTLAPSEPTYTPAPPTDTPTPTPVSPVAIGDDWPQNCISTLWQPVPSMATVPLGDGCSKQPIYFFATRNGSLNFRDVGAGSSAEAYGLFAILPGTEGSVTVKVSLRELSKADLLMGVYEDAALTSQGMLMTIPYGNVKRQKIVQMLSYVNYKSVDSTAPVDQLDGYTIIFKYSPGLVTATIPGIRTFEMSVNSPQYIFIGYRKRGPGYTADGTFLSLKVDQ